MFYHRCTLVNDEVMTKAPLHISSIWDDLDPMNSPINFHSIVLDNMRVQSGPLFKCLQDVLPHIKSAEMRNVKFPMAAFTDFLNKAKSLEKLVISDLTIMDQPTPVEFATEQHTLTSLELKTSNWNCLGALKNTQFSELTIDVLEDYININHIKEFLVSQKNLESMTFKSYPISLISFLSSLRRHYGLKRLTINFHPEHFLGKGLKNLKTYLKLHKSTLQYLRINEADDALLEFISENLKVEELVVDYVTSLSSPKIPLVSNRHLKKLYFGEVGKNEIELVVKTLMGYPSIQHLTIGIFIDVSAAREKLIFEVICLCLPGIRHLTIPTLVAGYKNREPRIFTSLKTLEVGQLGKLGPDEKYFVDFKGVETVTIKAIAYKTVQKLVLPHVKHLKIGSDHVRESNHEKLRRHCPKICFLEFL